METNRRFIAKPYFLNSQNQLDQTQSSIHYTDVLTYVGIKSFDNPKEDCFPSLETIADKIGTSVKFVTPSIKRLEQSGYLEVHRSKKKKVANRYYFSKPKFYQRVPFDFFECTDLTHNEKAMLLLIREVAVSPYDIDGTRVELAARLGMKYNMFNTQFQHLINKGYIEQKSKRRFIFLKIDWYFEVIKKEPEKHLFILT